ncbi:hypothetical protein AB0L30_25485 [Microbispora rosea]|uniref:hypothetical protein n=1 Tax=Microbispora rosea TaxID=58117 RepID=UPI00341428A8
MVGDPAELDLPAQGITTPFDAVVCAGNVMTFLADAAAVALEPDLLLSTWDLRPFRDDSSSLVALLLPA